MATLSVIMGIPGSGKTTWATAHATATGAHLLTTDPVRTERSNIVATLRRIHETARHTLNAGGNVVIDACNIAPEQRKRWLKLARQAGATTELVAINTDPEVARERNAARPAEARVPEDRMAKYIAQLPQALNQITVEGWHRITRVGEHTPVETGLARTRDW